MMIVTDKAEASLQRTNKCSLCGGLLSPPFLEYHGCSDVDGEKTNIVCICKRCCCRDGKGLRADLIQIQAIAELESLYPGFTLVRDTRQRRERERGRDAATEIVFSYYDTAWADRVASRVAKQRK
jgi:hypothetical protein